MLERVVTTRSSRDESSTFYCLQHPSVLLPVSVSTLDFHFRQDLRLDFHKVESSVLIDDSSRCGCILHGGGGGGGGVNASKSAGSSDAATIDKIARLSVDAVFY